MSSMRTAVRMLLIYVCLATPLAWAETPAGSADADRRCGGEPCGAVFRGLIAFFDRDLHGSTGRTRPRSFGAAAPGAMSKRSSSPPWSGSIGSTTDVYSNRSAMSRQRSSSKRTIVLSSSRVSRYRGVTHTRRSPE